MGQVGKFTNSISRPYLRWLVFGCSTYPSLYLSPRGREDSVTLSLWERVAKGRVRAIAASILAALISSLTWNWNYMVFFAFFAENTMAGARSFFRIRGYPDSQSPNTFKNLFFR